MTKNIRESNFELLRIILIGMVLVLHFQNVFVSDFDEWIEKFLTKLAISCFQDKDLGIESNIKGIVADKIIEFGYIPNLPKFYQPELDKYVNFVLDRMNAFELARQAMVI